MRRSPTAGEVWVEVEFGGPVLAEVKQEQESVRGPGDRSGLLLLGVEVVGLGGR